MGASDRRIDVLMTADTVGGVWTHALELASGLGASGLRVAIASMGAPASDAQREQARRAGPAVSLHESAYRLEWMSEPWDDVRAAGDWLLQLEADLQPGVVHLNQFAFGALPFRAPTLLVAHSCVLTWWRAVHGRPAPTDWDGYRRVVGAGLRGATALAAPTRAMRDALRVEHGIERDGWVLPNARSAGDFAPASEKSPVIVSAGRFWDEAKNLAALAAVAPRLPWPVHVAGSMQSPDGSARAWPAGVQGLGELAPAALADVFARAAVYAAPARYEPFGQSALEAALAGCALVLGDIASLREVWGDAALYVAPDDHDALEAALRRLIDDPAERRARAAQARAQALRYTPERMVAAYRAAYGQLRADHDAAQAAPGAAAPREAACAS